MDGNRRKRPDWMKREINRLLGPRYGLDCKVLVKHRCEGLREMYYGCVCDENRRIKWDCDLTSIVSLQDNSDLYLHLLLLCSLLYCSCGEQEDDIYQLNLSFGLLHNCIHSWDLIKPHVYRLVYFHHYNSENASHERSDDIVKGPVFLYDSAIVV